MAENIGIIFTTKSTKRSLGECREIVHPTGFYPYQKTRCPSLNDPLSKIDSVDISIEDY